MQRYYNVILLEINLQHMHSIPTLFIFLLSSKNLNNKHMSISLHCICLSLTGSPNILPIAT